MFKKQMIFAESALGGKKLNRDDQLKTIQTNKRLPFKNMGTFANPYVEIKNI